MERLKWHEKKVPTTPSSDRRDEKEEKKEQLPLQQEAISILDESRLTRYDLYE